MATINRSQLKGKLLEVYDKIKERQKSSDPEIAEKAKKDEQEFVKKILEQVKKKKAEQEAEKKSGKAPSKKDKPKAKVAKKPAVKKAKTPTRVGNKPFMTQVKELSDKEGISFKEARSKLSKQLAEEKKKSEQKAKKELENLLSIVRSPIENKGLNYKPRQGNKASNPKKGAVKLAGSDAKRLAKPVGKRVSKNGKTYYEYRDNRSDRNSIPAPKGEYKYKGVTPPYLEMGGITDLSTDSLDAITYAEGGKLSTHGLEIGDVIQKEIKYPSGEVNLVVKDKNGVRVFVDLEDGYRDVNPPLPFEKGGRIVKIVNEGEEFDEEKYQAIFGDYDGDGVANINDISPLDKSNRGSVEQIELDQTFKKLIDLKNNLDDKMYKALDKLDKKAPKNAEFYARTKTPFSIVKKLVDKRLLDPKKGLTDMIGTTVVVENQAELEKVKNDINKGLMGDVLDFDDFYKNPNNGYRAYHFIVEFEGMPIEIQLKTKMQKQLNEVSHEFYKKGTLDAKGLDEVSKMIMQADKGDKQALAKVKKLLANKTELANKISNKMAKGGNLSDFKVGDKIEFETPYFESKLTHRGVIEELTPLGAKVKYKNNERSMITSLPLKRLKKLEKGGKLPEDSQYIPREAIYSIKLKDGREFENSYSEMEFLSGAYLSDKVVTEDKVDESQLSLFKKGGKLPKDAIYIKRRDIESVKLEDDYEEKEIKGKYLYNGFWIDPKKQSGLIAEAKKQGLFNKPKKDKFKKGVSPEFYGYFKGYRPKSKQYLLLGDDIGFLVTKYYNKDIGYSFDVYDENYNFRGSADSLKQPESKYQKITLTKNDFDNIKSFRELIRRKRMQMNDAMTMAKGGRMDYEAGGTLPTPFGQAGLVGETGAMNEMELFAMGGNLPQSVHQYFQQTNNPAFPTPHGYAKGGVIYDSFEINNQNGSFKYVLEKFKSFDGEVFYQISAYKDGSDVPTIMGHFYDENESIKAYNKLKNQFAKGGRLKSALIRDRKYFNKDESWERQYSKNKPKRKGYKEKGGTVKKKNTNRGEIMKVAKKIRKDGEAWKDALKRAGVMLRDK